ncbi:hypothetical protein N7465_005852 [Penicillium sp. CMV-2018d]|nr:hypothetical protein N7465_005852 [Penicillium sp. CMV-2018d]
MERSKPAGQSSTYGQACMHCYKAKSRCVRAPNGDKWFRLKKRCQPSESVRRRNAQMAEESDTRIARLEDKMEILLSAMQSPVSQGASGASANTLQSLQPVHSLDGNSISSSTSYSNGTLVSTSAGVMDSITTASPNPNLLFSSHHYSLDFFRSRMLPYFPFINLTPGMISSLFLLQAIYTVTIFSTQERLTQVEASFGLILSLLVWRSLSVRACVWS